MVLLDWIYPPSCALCECPLQSGRCLCDGCAMSLPRLRAPFCGACGEMFEGKIQGDFSCPNCEGLKFAFRFARPAMVRDPSTLELIHRLKYGREVHLAAELGRLGVAGLADPRFSDALAERWPLVPVPLHWRRRRKRHFNQSAEIARAIAKQTRLPLLHALKRVKSTDTQTRLNRRQRMANLRGAFEVTRCGRRAKKRGAIIVDDVLTTGSTVHACAQALKRAGYGEVMVLTVMRG